MKELKRCHCGHAFWGTDGSQCVHCISGYFPKHQEYTEQLSPEWRELVLAEEDEFGSKKAIFPSKYAPKKHERITSHN